MNCNKTLDLTGTIAVVKLGGSVIEDLSLLTKLLADLPFLLESGLSLALVHGGGKAIDHELAAMKKTPVKVQGIRVTDEVTLEIVIKALSSINNAIVKSLSKVNVPAIGYIPSKNSLFEAVKLTFESTGEIKDAAIDLGYVGKICKTDTAKIKEAFLKGAVPIVAPLACGVDGTIYNINADSAALALAHALGASKLVCITDVPGLLENPTDPATLIANISLSEAKQKIANGQIAGGMIPKLESCIGALECGIKSVHIIDGTSQQALLNAFTNPQAIGTTIYTKELCPT